MNATEQRAKLGLLILDYTDQRQRLALLKNDVNKVVNRLRECATSLALHPETVQASDFISTDQLAALLSDVRVTTEELRRLSGVLRDAGWGHILG